MLVLVDLSATVALTFRYWRLEKILPQPSKSHRRISRFAAFLRKRGWKITVGEDEQGGELEKAVGFGFGTLLGPPHPPSLLPTHQKLNLSK